MSVVRLLESVFFRSIGNIPIIWLAVSGSSGSSTTKADDKYTKENIFKFLGKFPALSGKKYVVEVKFTKDGTPLNVANPHLIVIKQGEE